MLEAIKTSSTDTPGTSSSSKSRALSPLNPGAVPLNWDVVSIGSVSTKVTNGFVGSSLPHQVDEPGVVYLQGFNVRPSRIELRKRTYVKTAFHEANKKSQLKAGDVLVVQSGHIGTAARVPDGFGDDHLRQTRWWLHHINSGGSGSVRQRTYYDDLAALQLPLPGLEEQRAIMAVLDAAKADLSATNQMVEALTQQKRGPHAEIAHRRMAGQTGGRR